MSDEVDEENEFQWLIDGDESIVDASTALIETKEGKREEGIVIEVGTIDGYSTEIVFSQSDLERMLEIVKANY
jgi:hypothetical protein